MKYLIGLLLSSALLAQPPGAPSNLTVTSATNKAVALSWTAGTGATSYLVERRPLGGSYSGLSPQPTVTTFTDSSFDAFETYTYRVTSRSAGGSSVASNEVETGPPPIGFNVVSPTPNIEPDASQYGRQLSMALDGNGDPAMAYLHYDPNNDGDATDTTLYFSGWDRANYRWKSPVKVDSPGNVSVRGVNVVLAIACDASTGRLGIAYSKDPSKSFVAFSNDNGVTWTPQQGPSDGVNEPMGISFRMGGGQGYLAFYSGSSGMLYYTGSSAAAPSAWTKTLVPLPIKSGEYRSTLTMALDNAAQPALAFIYDDTSGPSVGFWRPGSSTSSRVVEIKLQNDSPDIRMTFLGTQPRIALNAGFSSAFFNAKDQVWSIQSKDGVTWDAPVSLPNDGKESWDGPLAIAVRSDGFGTIVATIDGGSTAGAKCGEPKWAQSADFKTWTTCSPQGANPPAASANYPAAAYAVNDKIYLAFQNYGSSLDVPSGVILYREPVIVGQQPAPFLSSGGVVNGASFAAGSPVAPGSIVSIFGSNLATSASGSGPVPLATTLVSSSVSIAGRLAPLFYVSQSQINAQIPFETPAGSATVSVEVNGLQSNVITVQVANSAPGVFLYLSNHAVAQHPGDLSIDSPDNPSKVGSVIVVYATGQGAVSVLLASGAGAPSAEPLARTSLATTCTIGGKDAAVQFAGLTPGLVGLLQVNVVVPPLAKGDYPLVLTIGGVASPAATLSVTP